MSLLLAKVRVKSRTLELSERFQHAELPIVKRSHHSRGTVVWNGSSTRNCQVERFQHSELFRLSLTQRDARNTHAQCATQLPVRLVSFWGARKVNRSAKYCDSWRHHRYYYLNSRSHRYLDGLIAFQVKSSPCEKRLFHPFDLLFRTVIWSDGCNGSPSIQ